MGGRRIVEVVEVRSVRWGLATPGTRRKRAGVRFISTKLVTLTKN